MAETQKASIGWGGAVFLSPTNLVAGLVELVQVVSFTLPDNTTDRVETTHLKSPNRRREYTAGLTDGGEVEVVLNFRPGSDTDLAIVAAIAAGDEKAIKFVVPQLGVAAWQYSTLGIVTGYNRGSITVDGKMEATMTIAITGAVTAAVAT